MKADVPTHPPPPHPPDDLSCTNYGIDGSDGNSKILENEKFLRAWNYIYKVCTIHQIYVYHMNGCKNKKILVLYIVSYFHLIQFIY